jgi:hypothetical protein
VPTGGRGVDANGFDLLTAADVFQLSRCVLPATYLARALKSD